VLSGCGTDRPVRSRAATAKRRNQFGFSSGKVTHYSRKTNTPRRIDEEYYFKSKKIP
jgi:hypothetical protein